MVCETTLACKIFIMTLFTFQLNFYCLSVFFPSHCTTYCTVSDVIHYVIQNILISRKKSAQFLLPNCRTAVICYLGFRANC